MAVAAPVALGLAAAGQISQGLEANRAARAQASVDDENARLALLEGEQQGLQTRKDERMQAGAALVGMAGSGMALGTGSIADLLAESAYQGELEVLNIRTRATRQANGLRQSADDRRAAGRAAILNGVFGAASTALQGASDMHLRNSVLAERQVAGSVPRMSVGSFGSVGAYGGGLKVAG